MEDLKIEGRVKNVSATRYVGKNGDYPVRELTLDITYVNPNTGERGYENTPVFEFTGERAAQLDTLHIDERVTVFFTISGRPYTNKAGESKVMTGLRGSRVVSTARLEQAPPVPAPTPTPRQRPGTLYADQLLPIPTDPPF